MTLYGYQHSPLCQREDCTGNERLKRLKRIAELMQADPEPDSPEGRELKRLVDEQVEAERGIIL